jgi:hypothetical protein
MLGSVASGNGECQAEITAGKSITDQNLCVKICWKKPGNTMYKHI